VGEIFVGGGPAGCLLNPSKSFEFDKWPN